jgi:hypothetical protein
MLAAAFAATGGAAGALASFEEQLQSSASNAVVPIAAFNRMTGIDMARPLFRGLLAPQYTEDIFELCT